jgi:hypothetical protein
MRRRAAHVAKIFVASTRSRRSASIASVHNARTAVRRVVRTDDEMRSQAHRRKMMNQCYDALSRMISRLVRFACA